MLAFVPLLVAAPHATAEEQRLTTSGFLYLFLAFLGKNLLQGETDAEVVKPVGRGEVAAISTATVRSIAEPATATIHTESARSRTRRVCLCIAAVSIIPVTAPLPNITAHVIDT